MAVSVVNRMRSGMHDGIRLLICGGGNGAHVLAGVASSQEHVAEARVLTLYPGEAQEWSFAMKSHDFQITVQSKNAKPDIIKTKPKLVSDRPSTVIPGCDLIVLTVPACAHAEYLNVLKPYIAQGTSIVGLPGNAGFDFAVRAILGDVTKTCSILSFESLPWACQITQYGRSANVTYTKGTLSGAVVTGNVPPRMDPKQMMQYCLGKLPTVETNGHLLGITLMGTNGYLNPAIMYGKWHNWNGKPLDEVPKSYNGLDEYTADTISGISDEIVSTAKEIMRQRPNVDLSNVSHVYNWYLKCYDADIDDKTNLYTCIRTNKAYTGFRHPMTQTYDKRYVPDFGHHYLWEDVPFGLVVMKGIAAIAGIATPNMDKVITWAQTVMSKEYLMDGELTGSDVRHSRAPQRYGIITLDEMLALQ